MVAGPAVGRLVDAFIKSSGSSHSTIDDLHHEDSTTQNVLGECQRIFK